MEDALVGFIFFCIFLAIVTFDLFLTILFIVLTVTFLMFKFINFNFELNSVISSISFFVFLSATWYIYFIWKHVSNDLEKRRVLAICLVIIASFALFISLTYFVQAGIVPREFEGFLKEDIVLVR